MAECIVMLPESLVINQFAYLCYDRIYMHLSQRNEVFQCNIYDIKYYL